MILISYFRYYNYYLWPLDSICLLLSPTFTALLLFYGQHSLCDRCRKMGAYQWPQFISNRFLFILFLRQFLFCSTFFFCFFVYFVLFGAVDGQGRVSIWAQIHASTHSADLFFFSVLVLFGSAPPHSTEKKKRSTYSPYVATTPPLFWYSDFSSTNLNALIFFFLSLSLQCLLVYLLLLLLLQLLQLNCSFSTPLNVF